MLLAVILSLVLSDPSITGVVKDTNGGAIVGASVVVKSGSDEQKTVTGPDGHFTIERAPAGPATLIVKAGGFAVKEQPISSAENIEVVLAPAAILETVTVTPSRTEQRIGDVAASVNVVDSTDIKQSGAVVADDVLRSIPTFSLFTRASSLSAHPTSQGVSLRGIGPSGVSRTLVMSDGVPVNDPFGGWVYWTRFPLESVDRIEVVDGPSSSLYGNYAMGGVINVLTAHPSRRTIELKPQYGNLNSPKIDAFGSDVWGKLGVTLDAAAYDTDGFPIVAEGERRDVSATPPGVDNKAAVKFQNTNLKLSYAPTSRVSTSLRTGYFHEERANGKESTIDQTEEGNHTRWSYVSGTVRLDLPGGNDVQASLFTNEEHFFSNFLAVPAVTPVRSLGRMSLNQTVPSNDLGGSVQWSRGLGRMNFVSVGGDFHWVKGDSQEDSMDAVTGLTVATHRVSGGRQQSQGAYIQDIFTPLSNLTLTFAARVDHFRNYDAHNLENAVSGGLLGAPTANNFPDLPGRTDTVATPRASAAYRVTNRINVWGDVNSGFRAPTLNELYRQFRKGAVLTLPNYELVPERLVGTEIGTSIALEKHTTLRVTGFDNRVRNPVTNVTMPTAFGPPAAANPFPTTASCTPNAATTCVLRQNVGKTEIKGVQMDADFRWKSLHASGAYVLESAKVIENGVTTSLVGKDLAQVPKNRGSIAASFSDPRWFTLALDEQFVGAQFDDDQNTVGAPPAGRQLPAYKVTNLTATRQIIKGFDAFFGVQNLFNVVFDVATQPTTIGAPRMYNGGVRIRWSGR